MAIENNDLPPFELRLAALQTFLGKTRDVNAKLAIQGYVIPLLQALRDETADAFDVVDERLEDIEEDGVSAKAAKLVDGAKTVLELFYNVLNDVMLTHGYIENNDYTDKVDPLLKQKHASAYASMVEWFKGYAEYAAERDDDPEEEDDDGDDDDDGEAEPVAQDEAA